MGQTLLFFTLYSCKISDLFISSLKLLQLLSISHTCDHLQNDQYFSWASSKSKNNRLEFVAKLARSLLFAYFVRASGISVSFVWLWSSTKEDSETSESKSDDSGFVCSFRRGSDDAVSSNRIDGLSGVPTVSYNWKRVEKWFVSWKQSVVGFPRTFSTNLKHIHIKKSRFHFPATSEGALWPLMPLNSPIRCHGNRIM